MKLFLVISALLAPSLYADPSPAGTAPTTGSEAIVVEVPTRLRVKQSRDTVEVTTAEFQKIKLTFGSNLVKGTWWEANIRQGSNVISLRRGLRGGSRSDIKVERFADILTRGRNKVPSGKGEFAYEYTLTIFETDEPTTHMWEPKHGKAYRVVWAKTFKELVK